MRNFALTTLITLVTITLVACDGNNTSAVPRSTTDPTGRYLSTQSYTFNTNVDPATLIAVKEISLTALPNNSYVINNISDLNALTQYDITGFFATITDLNSYSYFIIQDAACPEYYKYLGDSYQSGLLTISLNLFTRDNYSCPEFVGVNSYGIYKAMKAL
jgi:hypothetical protein